MSPNVLKTSLALSLIATLFLGGACTRSPENDAEAARLADRLVRVATCGAEAVPDAEIAAFEKDVLPTCAPETARGIRLLLAAYRFYQADLAQDAEQLKALLAFAQDLLAQPGLPPEAATALATKIFSTYADLQKDFDGALAFLATCKSVAGLGDAAEKPLAGKLRTLEGPQAIALLRKLADYPCFNPADPLARQTQELVKRLRGDTAKAPEAPYRDAIAFAAELLRKATLSEDAAGALAAQVFTAHFSDFKDTEAALAFLATCKPGPALKRGVHRTIAKKVRELDGASAVALLRKFAACPWFNPPDYLGQLAGESFTRFGGDGKNTPAQTAVLKDFLAFANDVLPRCSERGQADLKESLLNGYFLAGDFKGAIGILEKGAPADKSANWRNSMVAKLRAHIAMEAGDKPEAIRQLTAFIAFMLSDEQKEFDECDPATGLVYSREWVVGLNYVRCLKMARELKDPKADEYLALARKYYATALDKAKNDAKSLEAVKAEMKDAGL